MGHEDFEVAVPRDPGVLGLEVMALARPAGRMLDHLRLVIGGSEPLRATFTAHDLFLAGSLPAVSMIYEIFPRDVKIRRNMATSIWRDVQDLLSSNELVMEDGASNEELLFFLERPSADRKLHTASVRWAVGVAPDGFLELVLQSLPAAANLLSGKPSFNG